MTVFRAATLRTFFFAFHAGAKELIEFPKAAFSDADWLKDLAVLLKRCLVLLEEVQSPTTVDAPTFVASIAEKLPLELKREWLSCALTIQRQKGELAGFEEFAEFVIEQSVKANSVYCKLLFPKTTQRGDASTNRARARTSKVLTSVTTVPTGSKEVKHAFKESCLCCKRAHKLEDCPEFRQMTLRRESCLYVVNAFVLSVFLKGIWLWIVVLAVFVE